jgi:hypothetical protein
MVKNGRWLYILSVAGGVAFLPGVAAATDASGYLGGGVGYFRLDEKRFLDEDEDFRDNRFAWHATAGVQFTPVFSLEGGYIDFGKPEDENSRIRLKGWQVAGMVHLPLTQNFAPYAKLGQLFWDRDRERTVPSVQRRSDSGNDTFFGLGARFDLSQVTQLRVGYDRISVDNSDLDLATLSLQYRF